MTDTSAPASPAATEMALLPCAHCGGDAEFVPMRLWADDENDPPVFCNVCHTSALNAAAWNRRAPTPDMAALRAERDRLRDGLKIAADALEEIAERTWDKRHPDATRQACDDASAMAGEACDAARAALAEGRADGELP